MKKEIDVEIKYDFQWTYGITIDDLIEDINSVKELGATHIFIEPEDNWGVCRVEITAIQRRIETDEEYKIRIDREKRDEQVRYAQKLKQYEDLKKFFENNA